MHSIRYRAVRTVGRGIVPKLKTARAGAVQPELRKRRESHDSALVGDPKTYVDAHPYSVYLTD